MQKNRLEQAYQKEKMNHRVFFFALFALCLCGSSLFLLLVAMPVTAQETPTADPCAGLVQPRLMPMQGVRVIEDDGIGLVLRDAPGGAVLAVLPEGTLFQVMNGATCQDGLVWWEVRLANGQHGYITEGGTLEHGYLVEPYEVGGHVYQLDPANPDQLNHTFVDLQGTPQPRPSQALVIRTGTLAQLWQSFEVDLANQVLLDREINCPDRLDAALIGRTELGSMAVMSPARTFYPAPNGARVLLINDYLLPLPDCGSEHMTRYGTSYVSMVRGTGEELVFPFSQHAAPQTSVYCQPPTVTSAEYPTLIEDAIWSPDGGYVALVVRYLRDGAQFPCAFYHVFVINASSLTLHYIGEGQRVGWRGDGHRLYMVREERSDPNTAGLERLFSVLPDGSDWLEIPLPPGMIWLPDNLNHLPWSPADKILLCNDPFCDSMVLFSIREWAFSSVINVPAEARPGMALKSVQLIAGDTALLWLNTEGQVFRQVADGSPAVQIEIEGQVSGIIPVSSGMGAILQLSDGRYFYYDALERTIKEIMRL